MVSSASSRDDSQEKKSLLDKPNSSKTTKSASADPSGKSGKTEKSTEKSVKRSNDKSAKSGKSGKSVKTTETGKSERGVQLVTSRKSTTSIQSSVGRRGPKMSDGTEYDTGPYGYIFSFIYLFLLWGLAIIAAIALIYYNYARLDPQYPSYFGEGSFLGSVPKATFDPNPRRFQEEGTKNLMEWNIYEFKSYVNFLIRYKKVLKGYLESGKPKDLCKNKKLTDKEACSFDRVTGFGDCVLSADYLEHGFGYSKGQPCIMLKVNKILGWVPNLKNHNKTCPSNDLCCGEGIKFECTSNDDANFEYYPKNGIPACYFPYANQKGYEQPYQMIKVSNLTFNREITIECSPTDESLRNLHGDKKNEARFHILMKNDSPK